MMRDQRESSVTKLEELVKCGIHLDKLNDPRMLPCAHVFCLECISNAVANLPPNSPLKCPICSRMLPQITSSNPDKVMELPKACFHNELEEYLDDRCEKKRLSLDSSSNQDKIQLHKLLLDHPDCTFPTSPSSVETNAKIRKFSDIQSYCKTIDSPPPSKDLLSSTSCCSNNEENCIGDTESHLSSCIDLNDSSGCEKNSAYCLSCSQNDQYSIIKNNMRKYSRYRVLQHYVRRQHNSITNSFKSTTPEQHSLNYFVCVVNSNNGTVEIRKPDSIFAVINPTTCKGCPLKPIFAKYFDNTIYVSGVTLMNEGFLVKMSIENSIIVCSASLQIISNLNEPFPIGDFCFDVNNQQIYFAIPAESRVAILSMSDLHESKMTYTFDLYQPVFLAYRSSSNEVWISCPKEHRLLVMDISDNSYQQLPIDRVNTSSPLQIVCAWDSGRSYQRVIFLDSDLSRLFWILKQGSHVDIQGISFPHSQLKHFKICQLTSLDDDNRLVIISDDNEVCIATPEKDIPLSSPSKRDEANCILL